MDERKRQIDLLEKNRQENRDSLDLLLTRFGESLFNRMADKPVEYEDADVTEYRRLQKDIADSNSAILSVEEQIRRQRELEEGIELKEQENKERAKELAAIHLRLGKALLEDATDAYADFTAPFREQADALIAKVDSLESRIKELEQKEGSNVFVWIGKGAQGLVLRSFLSRAQENLEQLYRNAGENFTQCGGETETTAVVAALKAEIEKAGGYIKVLTEDLKELRDEKRLITAEFEARGNPLKQIQSLKNHIGQAKEKLNILHRRLGAQAASVDFEKDAAELSPQRKQFIDTLIGPEDQDVLANAARLNQAIQNDETAIGKLRASLAIDGEKAKIEKCRKSIEDKKMRIVDAQKAISDLEDSILDSEKYIGELQKLL